MTNQNSYNSNVSTALGQEGLGEQSWWVAQWMELINSYRYKKRLERAWIYAREGNVTSIRFEGRRVHGRVQGTDKNPYKVKLWLDVLNDEDWRYVLKALAQKAKWSAQLLAGIMPLDIEQAFAASGKRLFPFQLDEVKSECSCPDKANPCKHISAIYYLMGDRFKEDPFVLFQLRGRDRKRLLEDLSQERLNVHQNIKSSSESNHSINDFRNKQDYSNQNTEFLNPHIWWEYKNALNDNLVVITSGVDDEKGLNSAGELPFAEGPKFPNSNKIFLNNLSSHGEISAQLAMIKAMSTGN